MKLPKFLRPIKWFYQAHVWGLKGRLRNLWIFAYAVWHFDTCDYAPLLRLIRVATKEMIHTFKHHGIVIDSDKVARQLTIVTELCRRMEEDNYFENAGYDPKTWNKKLPAEQTRIAKHTKYMTEQDALYFGKMMKRIQCWWQ